MAPGTENDAWTSPAFALGFQAIEPHKAGPRLGGKLPATYDQWPPDPDPVRQVVLAALAVDGAADDQGGFKPRVYVEPGKPLPGTLTLINRGEVQARGEMRLSIEPPAAGRIEGPDRVSYDLAPDQEMVVEFAVVLGPGAERVLIEAAASGKDLPVPTALYVYGGTEPTEGPQKTKRAPGAWD